jgi:hypothetical protein
MNESKDGVHRGESGNMEPIYVAGRVRLGKDKMKTHQGWVSSIFERGAYHDDGSRWNGLSDLTRERDR